MTAPAKIAALARLPLRDRLIAMRAELIVALDGGAMDPGWLQLLGSVQLAIVAVDDAAESD